jgi:hypothetical protein
MGWETAVGAETSTKAEGEMTQKEAVLQALKMGPVCSFAFYESSRLTHRLGARIYDLRRDGYEISSKPCRMHDHESYAVVYELAETDQLVLPL